jgi:hypothetical protein
MFAQVSDREALDAFQSATRSKLAGALCPKHGQTPHVEFSGSSLRDVSIRLTACCAEGISAANRAIAEPPPAP